jgi:hypothetical protein
MREIYESIKDQLSPASRPKRDLRQDLETWKQTFKVKSVDEKKPYHDEDWLPEKFRILDPEDPSKTP